VAAPVAEHRRLVGFYGQSTAEETAYGLLAASRWPVIRRTRPPALAQRRRLSNRSSTTSTHRYGSTNVSIRRPLIVRAAIDAARAAWNSILTRS